MQALMLLAFVLLTPPVALAPPPDVTAEAVLGLRAGMPLDEARRVLDPLGRGESRALTAGAKAVWKFDTGGYAWIALRTDADGRIVWLTGHRRAGHEVPFDTIAGTPDVATDSIAIWHSQGVGGTQRLTLRGAGRKAQVVTLAAVKG